jgi:hypothetical protein
LSSATCLNNVRLWLKMLVYGMLQKTCVGDRKKEAAYTKRENKTGVRDPAVLFVDRNTRTTHNGNGKHPSLCRQTVEETPSE